MNSSLFHQLKHPFVWTSPDDRNEVLGSVNEPIWHRFLEEAERHFLDLGELRPAKFPVFCHDGDLDEVMSVAVLAFVRQDQRYWRWIADWLRGLLSYYREAEPLWRENRFRVMRGEKTPMSAIAANPRQHFEGFTQNGRYWVEAGFHSCVLHLLDLLEAYAPEVLSGEETVSLLEALSDYATRYAFHEEAVKYNNRGMWANAGVLLSGIAHQEAKVGKLLRFQAARRNDEFRSTFLDDGFHAEGSPDYHIMAADAILAYSLTASHLESQHDVFAASHGSELFRRYPSFVDIVRAYLRTVIPGPVLWNHSRGCSVSTPLAVRPALVQAWKLTGDPEIGWFLRESMMSEGNANPTPMLVRKSALLGLGQYQPLLNFWLYRPVDVIHRPLRSTNVLPEHGGVFSRSGWHAEASCVTARFGYEGTGKGHRDHAHVTVTVEGINVLKDPFPRFGPAGLESSPFHNTVTLDQTEPVATVGSLQDSVFEVGADAFLIANSGGTLPDRPFYYDPREESNYWFTNRPGVTDFRFQRAILHVHNYGVAIVDRLEVDRPRMIDWFFHSDLVPVGYDATADQRVSDYQLRQRCVVEEPTSLRIAVHGQTDVVRPGDWHEVALGGGDARIRFMSPDTSLKIDRGHWSSDAARSVDGISFPNEMDYFHRVRAQTQTVHAIWLVLWNGVEPVVRVASENECCSLHFSGWGAPLKWDISYHLASMSLESLSDQC